MQKYKAVFESKPLPHQKIKRVSVLLFPYSLLITINGLGNKETSYGVQVANLQSIEWKTKTGIQQAKVVCISIGNLRKTCPIL